MWSNSRELYFAALFVNVSLWFLRWTRTLYLDKKNIYIYTMQSQLSLFGIFLFIVVQMAASPAFIMWTTPIERNGFPLWAEGSWTGSQEWTWAYLEFQAVLLRCASLWVRFLTSRGRHFTTVGFFSLLEPAVIAEACHTEAKMGLDCHLFSSPANNKRH